MTVHANKIYEGDHCTFWIDSARRIWTDRSYETRKNVENIRS